MGENGKTLLISNIAYPYNLCFNHFEEVTLQGVGMNQRFKIDGIEYEISSMNQEGRELVGMLTFIQLKLQELKNNTALLSKAKNAYIADLKTEIVQARTGVDFDDLFSDG